MDDAADLRDMDDSGESGAVRDPGLDRHEWETAWEGLQEQLHDAPAEALPELAQLVEEMLDALGYGVNDPVAGNADDVMIGFRSAREIAMRADRGDDVDPAEIGEAIHNLAEIYEELVDRPEN